MCVCVCVVCVLNESEGVRAGGGPDELMDGWMDGGGRERSMDERYMKPGKGSCIPKIFLFHFSREIVSNVSMSGKACTDG